ncbi:HAD-IA family hydrolase [Candidatus Beckwithbacteria bacterium]|nr:HAD-IA family hydrolase [Candidatus Beckwithbacteria bacterium]
MKIKAIIYDCVGPLLIKKKSWRPSKIVLAIDHKCGSALNDKIFWDEIKNGYGNKIIDVQALADKIADGYKKNIQMWEFHNQIKNIYKTGIINNGTFTIFDKWSHKFKFADNFNVMLNSAKLGIKKPDKKIFDIMYRRLGVKPGECVFIDDSKPNVIGARKAGLLSILYNPTNHPRFIKEFKKLKSNSLSKI